MKNVETKSGIDLLIVLLFLGLLVFIGFIMIYSHGAKVDLAFIE